MLEDTITHKLTFPPKWIRKHSNLDQKTLKFVPYADVHTCLVGPTQHKPLPHKTEQTGELKETGTRKKNGRGGIHGSRTNYSLPSKL